MIFCPDCGKGIEAAFKFCPYCGKPLPTLEHEDPQTFVRPFLSSFRGPHPWHLEVPRLEIESEL